MDREDKDHMKYISDKRGFTLVELLIAMIILTVGLLAVVGLFVAVIHGNASSKWVTAATALAEQEVERLKSLGYDALSVGTSASETITLEGAGTFSRQYTVTEAATNLKRIDVEVTWTDIGGVSKEVNLATLIAKK